MKGTLEASIAVFECASADVRHCIGRSKDEFYRRAVVHSTFRLVTAFVSLSRRMTLAAVARESDSPIPLTRLALLQDFEYVANDLGHVRRDRPKPVTSTTVALAFRAFAGAAGKNHGYIDEMIFGANEWTQLRNSFAVRDRIAQAVDPEQLVVTDAEFRALVSIHSWIVRFVTFCLGALPEVGNLRFGFRDDETGMSILLAPSEPESTVE